ncbi:hypothetical protein ACOSQ3_025600 [Xanthoceras sorbifolium]
MCLLCGFIWKWRCKIIFDKDFSIPVNPALIILKYKKEWVQANCSSFTSKRLNLKFIDWSPPTPDWIKLNIDGSRISDVDSIAAGGVFREHSKGWLGGFSVKRGSGSALEAELWGVFSGRKIAWEAGVKKMLVESDSTTTTRVDLLKRGCNL